MLKNVSLRMLARFGPQFGEGLGTSANAGKFCDQSGRCGRKVIKFRDGDSEQRTELRAYSFGLFWGCLSELFYLKGQSSIKIENARFVMMLSGTG